MSTIETPDEATSTTGVDVDRPQIRMLHDANEMTHVVDVFQQVWGSVTELIRIEMLMAIAHSGGYVAAAYEGSDDGSERIVGASVGILARHQDRPALHSHITGLLPGARRSGVGREIKLHQRSWAADHDIEWIVWTFDPLVRGNAWFNLAVLGAEVHGYLESFYGTMTDAINAGDDSDRLLVAWPVTPVPDRQEVPPPETEVRRVPTPDDIVTLRRTDPAEATRWRRDVRRDLGGGLAAGDRVVGFTRDGDYLLVARS